MRILVSGRIQRGKWWAQKDLNLRPADYEKNGIMRMDAVG